MLVLLQLRNIPRTKCVLTQKSTILLFNYKYISNAQSITFIYRNKNVAKSKKYL
jgi:hypothetical protein